jgi:hypothetical protein
MYAKSCEQLLIANNLKKAGWSLGYVSAIDSSGRTIWIADAHRGDGKRFVVRADEKLTAFVEIESVIRALTFDHPKRLGSATSIELTSLTNSE